MQKRFDGKKLAQTFQNFAKNAQPFTGTVYRVVMEGLVANYGIDSIIAGRGPKEFQGGRWMVKGICYVLYTSFTASLAIREIIRNSQNDNKKFILARLHIRQNKILDLTSKDNLQTLNTKIEDLVLPYSSDENKESYTQAIGRYAYESGIEGIKVPSAVDQNETNLVIFSKVTPIAGVVITEWETFFS